MSFSRNTIRVLHVDDEPDFADLTATCLQREDDRLEVETATTADDGLDRLADTDFDCIVSDYDMPGRNGIEFLRAVREEYPDHPFILYTGKGSEEVASEAITAGVSDYLQKKGGSSQYTVLANRIENAVSQHRAERRAAEQERISTVVREIGRALVRTDSAADLEQRVCDIISDSDPYLTACIAGVERETMRIEPRTWAGEAQGYFEELGMTVDEDSPGRCAPGGQAFHEREVAVSQDIRSDPRYEKWREAAIERGFRSLAVVPLVYEDDLYGLLAVFADRPDAFDDAERRLLSELGNDVAHALHSLRIQAQLRRERDRLTALFENSTDPRIEGTISDDGTKYRITDVNDAFEDEFGYATEEIVGRDVADVVVPDAERPEHGALRDRVGDGESLQAEVERQRADGVRTYLLHVVPYGTDATPADGFYASYTDIAERKERELELRQTTARLEALFENSPDMINVHDAAGNILDPNPRLCEKTGCDASELTGRKVWELDRAMDPDTAHALWDGMEIGDSRRLEGAYRRRDGSTFPVEVHVRHLDLEGEDRFLAISRDISEHKQKERELELYREYTDDLLDGIDDLFFVHDEAGNLQRWNDSLGEVTGYSDAEIASMNGSDFVPESVRERAAAAIEQVFAEGHARLEAPLRTKDGSTIPYEYVANRVVHPDGDPRLVGIGRDITERKAREEKLARYERIVEALNDIATIIEPDGTIRYVSPSVRRVLGYDPEELIGENGSGYQPPETAEAVADTIERVVENPEETRTVQTRFRRADGSWCWIESTLQNRLDDDVIEGILVSSRDVTERRRQRDELERQNERLEEFAGVVSHDLRNLLNIVEGRIDLLRSECDSEHLGSIDDLLTRMDRLIDDVLRLAREGRDIGATEAVAVRETVESTWSMVADGAEGAELRYAGEWNPDRTIEADRERLCQLLENLFGNAIEHGGEDVTVTVGELEDGYYVEDDGPGVPEADRDDVFDAGYSTTADGTGFGLSIVERIAEAHGWEIRATESSGGGARFEITGATPAE